MFSNHFMHRLSGNVPRSEKTKLNKSGNSSLRQRIQYITAFVGQISMTTLPQHSRLLPRRMYSTYNFTAWECVPSQRRFPEWLVFKWVLAPV